MAPPTERDAYVSRCLRIASRATSSGVAFRKSDGKRAPFVLTVSGRGKSVDFPIVTDEREWPETTVEAAFYSVLLDARGWSEAHVDDASIATLVDDVERSELPLIRRDLGEELARIAALAEVVGGRANLEALWEDVELTIV